MSDSIPAPMPGAYRITLTLEYPESRMDNVLLHALRESENPKLRAISRSGLKDLFNEKKIFIKGQRAKSSSALAKGVTYVDIVGF